MRPPKFVPIGMLYTRRVIAFPIFSNTAAVRHFEFLKILIFDHMTVIEVLICCVIKMSSKLVDAFSLQRLITAQCSMRCC